ncbi:MAG: hypothetical protein WCG27_08300, partial [Pseudomonadota bacterium]
MIKLFLAITFSFLSNDFNCIHAQEKSDNSNSVINRYQLRGKKFDLVDSLQNRLIISLTPTLQVEYSLPDKAGGKGQKRFPPQVLNIPPWSVEKNGNGWVLTSKVQTAIVEYILSWEYQNGNPQLIFKVVKKYLQDVLVHHEEIQWQLPKKQKLFFLGRDYHFNPLEKNALVSGGNGPKMAYSLLGKEGRKLFTMIGQEGIQSLRGNRNSSHNLLALELESEKNHPFIAKPNCNSANGKTPSAINLSAAFKKKGQVERPRTIILLGETMPILWSRYPDGFDAALSLSDHADQSSFSKTIILNGDPAQESQRPGLITSGVLYTKSIFLKKAKGYSRQFDNPSFLQLIKKYYDSGEEIAIHSISGITDLPRDCKYIVEARKHFPIKTWIDHSPTDNCEAISNRGWDQSSSWFMLDKLEENGIRNLWAVKDIDLSPGSLNMLRPEKKGEVTPAIFFHDGLYHQKDPFILFN